MPPVRADAAGLGQPTPSKARWASSVRASARRWPPLWASWASVEAFQAVQQVPQPKDPFGPDGIGQTVQLLGGEVIHGGCQRGQPVRPPARLLLSRMCVRFQGGNLSRPRPKTTTHANLWTTF